MGYETFQKEREFWSKRDLKILVRDYPTIPIEELAITLRRSILSIQKEASRRRIRKVKNGEGNAAKTTASS